MSKSCKDICRTSYLKEHNRVLLPEQNKPNKATEKIIIKDCERKMCNSSCENTFLKDKKTNFHSDYTKGEVNYLKSIGALSWCHSKPVQIGNLPVFDVMNLEPPKKKDKKKRKSKKNNRKLKKNNRKSKKNNRKSKKNNRKFKKE